jgi:hypothetical protein
VVTSSDRLAGFLGTLMIAGSLAGVLLSLGAVVVLALIGEVAMPWPLSADGWWAGDYAGLKFTVGFGILLLGATPVIMLSAFFARALKERRWGTVLATFALFLVLGFGLFKVLG